MSIEDLYDDPARERVVAEPPKRVDAPVRLARWQLPEDPTTIRYDLNDSGIYLC